MGTGLPTLAPEADPAARAFTRLAEKVDLLEAAIAGLAAKREAVPDYSETLGEIAALLGKMREAINTLAARPAMTLTPDAMARQIAAAGETARAADRATIKQARDRIDKAASHIERLAGTAATIHQQNRNLWRAAGVGFAAGCLLMAAFPGFVARIAPTIWHWPERLAARTVREPTLWETGARLMQADSPRAWQALNQAAEMLRDNRETIEECQETATKTKEPVRCTIRIKKPSS